jgi:hypothetical protein
MKTLNKHRIFLILLIVVLISFLLMMMCVNAGDIPVTSNIKGSPLIPNSSLQTKYKTIIEKDTNNMKIKESQTNLTVNSSYTQTNGLKIIIYTDKGISNSNKQARIMITAD